MSQPELLRRVVSILDGLGIPAMITGSIASSALGEPRSTHDIDLVVVLSMKHAKELVGMFPEHEFYLDEESVRTAIANHDQFNLIDLNSGDKVDFWLLTESPFDQERFSRRMMVEMEGIMVPMTTPEDIILQKLLWCRKMGGSEKQLLDALHVYEVQFEALDLPYIERWVDSLDVRTLWNKLRSQAQLP